MSELSLTSDPPREDIVKRFALSLFSCARSPGMCVPFGTFGPAKPMRYLDGELVAKKNGMAKQISTAGACEVQPDKAGYKTRESCEATIDMYRAEGFAVWAEKCSACGRWHIMVREAGKNK